MLRPSLSSESSKSSGWGRHVNNEAWPNLQGAPVVQGVLCNNWGCWTCFTSLVLAKLSPCREGDWPFIRKKKPLQLKSVCVYWGLCQVWRKQHLYIYRDFSKGIVYVISPLWVFTVKRSISDSWSRDWSMDHLGGLTFGDPCHFFFSSLLLPVLLYLPSMSVFLSFPTCAGVLVTSGLFILWMVFIALYSIVLQLF